MGKCAVFDVAGLLGRKWTIVIVQQVALHGSEGFNAIFRNMQTISPKLLAARLRELEREGIIEKRVRAEQAALRAAYALTGKGRELNKVIDQLKAWNVRHAPAALPCAHSAECVQCAMY